MQYEISFFIEYTLRSFYIQVWFKRETPLLFFLIKTLVYRKKLSQEKNVFFSVDSVKIAELHVVRTWRHMQSE